MKKCNEHHGEIQYDEVIYTECPLCRLERDLDIYSVDFKSKNAIIAHIDRELKNL